MHFKFGFKTLIFTIALLLTWLGISSSNPGAFYARAHTSLAGEIPAPVRLPQAANNVILIDNQGKYPLGLNLDLLEDPSGKLTINEVSSPAYTSQFTRSQVQVPNYGFTSSVYWVRFSLDNETRQTSEWLLEESFARMQYIDLYTPLPVGTGFSVKQSGIMRPVSNRDVIYPNVVFSLNIPPGSQQTFYLRFQNGGSMTIPLVLWTNNAFFNASEWMLAMDWFFFGGILVLLVSHLLLLFTIRESSYLYFVILLASLLTMTLDYTGYLGVYFFPHWYRYSLNFFPLSLVVVFASILLFSDAFLELKSRHPKLHWISLSLLAVWAVFALLIPFVSYNSLALWLVPVGIISTMATAVIGLIAWNKGARAMRFFLLAWLGMAGSFFLVLLVREGIVPSTFFTENIYLVGFLFMAVSWTIALADRINLFRHETENAVHDLRSSERDLAQILEGLPLGIVVYNAEQKPRYTNKRISEITGNPHADLHNDPTYGMTLTQALERLSLMVAGSDQRYPAEKTPLHQALHGKVAHADDIEIIRGDKRIPLEVWASPIMDEDGSVKAVVAVFQDIAQRRNVEQELSQYRIQLEELVNERTSALSASNLQLDREATERKILEQILIQRIEWLSALHLMHQKISGQESLSDAYEKLADTIRELLDARTVFILRWDEQEDQFILHYKSIVEGTPPSANDLKGVFLKGAALRQNLEESKSLLYSTAQPGAIPAPFEVYCQDESVQTVILSPMIINQAIVGVLCLMSQDPIQDFLPQQHGLIERMAYDLAHLTEDAILLDQKRIVATLEERNRLSRELHDSVAQALYGISLFRDAARLALDSGKLETVKQHLDDLGELSHEAISDMRLLIFELRPPILEQEGLITALQNRLDSVEARAGFQTAFQSEGEIKLSKEKATELYWIAQESLNNILKHAHASQVRVELTGDNGCVRMIIEDNGVGFDPLIDEQRGGQGFRNIRERSDHIGAKYSIQSTPDQGTKIIIEVKQ